MHYFVYRQHKHESGTCRNTVEDARLDILEDMAKGVAIALQAKNYHTIARIGGRMEDVLTLDPVDEYGTTYASISTVCYSDKEWWIKKCHNVMCTAVDRAGDGW